MMNFSIFLFVTGEWSRNVSIFGKFAAINLKTKAADEHFRVADSPTLIFTHLHFHKTFYDF
jgi:hypothetical protein